MEQEDQKPETVPPPENVPAAPPGERFRELAELELEISRRLRSNQRFLERFLDEDFVDDEVDGDEQQDEDGGEEG